MAHVCVVKTWRKHFGFAEADDGSVVHISKEEIAGMRLKPGLTVTCDLVAVEGHGGRVKGVNVSGEGIVPPDDEPTPEETAAERAEWNRFKEVKIATMPGAGPKKTKGAGKGAAVKGAAVKGAAVKGAAVKGAAGKGAKSGKGGKGGKGAKGGKAAATASGAAFGVARPQRQAGVPAAARVVAARPAAPARGVAVGATSEERRVDPADGRAYTRQDFIHQYGGLAQWNAAAPRRPAPAGRGAPTAQKRVDPADGNSYTREQFIACYRGTAEWDRADPYNTNVGRGRGRR